MNLQILLSILVLSTVNLSFANCITNPFQKSELPKEMPEKTSMKWNEGGGMTPAWESIEVKDNLIIFVEKDAQEEEERTWFVEFPLEEKKKLYSLFVENKFDTIENDEREEIVYDAGSESVYIRAGKISKRVSYGMNSPLSGSNQTRYRTVAKAIRDLEDKYKDQAKEISGNIAIIRYNSEKHYFIKNAKRADLSYSEIYKFYPLVEKAIKEYNSKQTEDQKIKNLAKYKLQFLPFMTESGEKRIYVNALCSVRNRKWKREIVNVLDGGNCYFQLSLYLTNNEFEGFHVNGEA